MSNKSFDMLAARRGRGKESVKILPSAEESRPLFLSRSSLSSSRVNVWDVRCERRKRRAQNNLRLQQNRADSIKRVTCRRILAHNAAHCRRRNDRAIAAAVSSSGHAGHILAVSTRRSEMRRSARQLDSPLAHRSEIRSDLQRLKKKKKKNSQRDSHGALPRLTMEFNE